MNRVSKRQGATIEQEVPEVRDVSLCQHHWVIDTPAGPVSRGVCRLCGEEGEFNNFLEGTYWDDDMSLDQSTTAGRIPADIVQEDSASSEG